jgi:hypothetical protein
MSNPPLAFALGKGCSRIAGRFASATGLTSAFDRTGRLDLRFRGSGGSWPVRDLFSRHTHDSAVILKYSNLDQKEQQELALSRIGIREGRLVEYRCRLTTL